MKEPKTKNEALLNMKGILDGAEGRALTAEERSEFDSLERQARELPDAPQQPDPDTRWVRTDGQRGQREQVFSLRSDEKYADYLNDKMRNGGLSDKRKTATDFDTRAYWYGMATGDWSGHEAEQRASMQEGVSADGGFLVPVPVAGEWIDLLRDQIVFAQGNAHTVPWSAGSTLALPVFVTDPATQNPAETTDTFPPPSDATVNKYTFTARPYSLLETMSWEVLEDSAIDLAAAVQANMAKRLAVSVQADFIYGSGATTIQGFTGAAGLLTGVEGGGVNGAAPASATGYDAIDKGIEAVRSAKVEPNLIVTSPRAFQTYGRLKNTLNDALRPSPTVASFLNGENGKMFAKTTAVKDTQTVGTASNDCSDLFIMDSDRIYWAIRHDFSVMSLRERFATQRLLGVMAWQRLDATLTHAEGAFWLKGIVGS